MTHIVHIRVSTYSFIYLFQIDFSLCTLKNLLFSNQDIVLNVRLSIWDILRPAYRTICHLINCCGFSRDLMCFYSLPSGELK